MSLEKETAVSAVTASDGSTDLDMMSVDDVIERDHALDVRGKVGRRHNHPG